MADVNSSDVRVISIASKWVDSWSSSFLANSESEFIVNCIALYSITESCICCICYRSFSCWWSTWSCNVMVSSESSTFEDISGSARVYCCCFKTKNMSEKHTSSKNTTTKAYIRCYFKGILNERGSEVPLGLASSMALECFSLSNETDLECWEYSGSSYIID